MRAAGLVVARALSEMSAAAAARRVDRRPRRHRPRGAARGRCHLVVPGLRHGYGPFPAVICASVNERVVHGIPSPHGEARRRRPDLDRLRRRSSTAGTATRRSPCWSARSTTSRPGAVGGLRAGAVGRAGGGAGRRPARRHLARRRDARCGGSGRYGIVAGYGGHGIGSRMHMEPHILNYGRAGKGPRLQPGMALAIEPMITLGSRATEELDDGWTVRTVDGSPRGALGAHRGDPGGRALGADRRGRRPCRARGARRDGVRGRRLTALAGATRSERAAPRDRPHRPTSSRWERGPHLGPGVLAFAPPRG